MLWHFMIFAVIGLLVVAGAWRLRPEGQPLGNLSVVVGVAGSLLGGLLSGEFWPAADSPTPHPVGVLMSILGAVLLLKAYGAYARVGVRGRYPVAGRLGRTRNSKRNREA